MDKRTGYYLTGCSRVLYIVKIEMIPPENILLLNKFCRTIFITYNNSSGNCPIQSIKRIPRVKKKGSVFLNIEEFKNIKL